ncbi:MAG: 50S ribosome-binding GTPase [Clostridia bacterium]|nr:50S ribosome-binding GTPase [Clostridia bacterium]
MNKYCIGCGIKLQCEEPYDDGYVNPKVFENTVMCRRCFRLKHYGEYKVTNKSNSYYRNIIKNIFLQNELVIHIVDLFNMGNMDYIYSKVFSKAILVISKADILPKSVNKDKLIEYFKTKYPKYKEVMLISSDKNYNIDELLMLIMKYKSSKEVYVLGNSNAGKSTFINKMIKNYTDNTNFIVTSCMPSTTLNVISITINGDLTLLDTPGIINDGDITNYLPMEVVKNINVKEEINPRIYQVKDKTSLILNDIGRINVLNESNISIYISNKVEIDKAGSKNDKYMNLEETKIKIKPEEDLVIEGLCFIKVTEETMFEIYMPEHVDIYKRKKFIG